MELPRLDNPQYKDIYIKLSTSRCKLSIARSYGQLSCRISQLLFMLIALSWEEDLNRIKLQAKITNLLKKYDDCINDPALSRLYDKNDPRDVDYIPLSRDSLERYIFREPNRAINIFPMAIVLFMEADSFKREYPYGHITHYFLLIRRGDSFSIISSYGSDNVTIPQQELIIEPAEFSSFIDAVHSNNYGIILPLIRKYFLLNGVVTQYIDTESESRKKTITVEVEEGARKELEYYSDKIIRIYYFTNLVDGYIKAILEETSGGKKYKKIIKNSKKITKNNKRKTKNNKRKTKNNKRKTKNNKRKIKNNKSKKR